MAIAIIKQQFRSRYRGWKESVVERTMGSCGNGAQSNSKERRDGDRIEEHLDSQKAKVGANMILKLGGNRSGLKKKNYRPVDSLKKRLKELVMKRAICRCQENDEMND